MLNSLTNFFRKPVRLAQDLIERNTLKVQEAWCVVHTTTLTEGIGKEIGTVYVRDVKGQVWRHQGTDACHFVTASNLQEWCHRILRQGRINPVWWDRTTEGHTDLPNWSSRGI